MKNIVLLTFILLLNSISVFAQSDFYLHHKKNGRYKKLRGKTFFVVTTPGASYFGKLIKLTDTMLVISKYRNPDWRREPLKYDSIDLRKIKSLENPMINNGEAYTLGGMFIIGAGLGLAATPIIWLAKGEKEGVKGLTFSGVLLAIGGIALSPALIKKKYSFEKWELVTK